MGVAIRGAASAGNTARRAAAKRASDRLRWWQTQAWGMSCSGGIFLVRDACGSCLGALRALAYLKSIEVDVWRKRIT